MKPAVTVIGLAIGASALMAGRCPAASPMPRPNIVLFFLDDAGFGDLGFTGATEYQTPHIDRLAAEGVYCTDAYVCASQCQPSRFGMLTGRSPHRFPPCGNGSPAMDSRELTIGDLLRRAGYRTAIVGKWHLGNSSSCIQPGDRGFDRYFVIPKCGGSNGYLNQTYLANSLDPIKTEGYATEIFAERAIDFIRESAGKDQPFFLYLSFNAPHAPFIAPQKYLDRVPNLTGDRRAVAAMILAVDDAIGRVMQTLEEKGVSRNTLVFLLNDNGALASRVKAGVNSQGPFKGGKNGYSEGGLRTPFVVRWPERLPAGKKFLHPVWSLDIVPTCVAAAGHTLLKDRPFDGVDLMPYLRSEKSGVPHEILYWRVGKPLRIGNWKFAGHFYHLRDDPGEANLLHGREYHAMEYQARRISEYIRQQIEVDGPVSFAEFDLSLYFLGTEEER